jgi:hypothetical protein
MVADGRAEPLPEYVELIQAARYLGHGRPDLQATLPVYWTRAAILMANAENEARAEEKG